MKNKPKYKVIRISKWVFTIILYKSWDNIYGDYVMINVRDWFYPPRNIFEKIKILFTTKNYGNFTWLAEFTDETLEDFIVNTCDHLVNNFLLKEKIDKQWEEIDKGGEK